MSGAPQLAFAKPERGTAKRARHARTTDLNRRDRIERAKCQERSGGRCERRLAVTGLAFGERCRHKAAQNHHLKGGRGRRNRGNSLLAFWRLDLCAECHRLITDRQLVPVNPAADARSMIYMRKRGAKAERT